MTNEELEAYLQARGWNIEQRVVGPQTFIIIRDYVIPAGNLAGRSCDVAIERTTTVPYVAPAAIHTRPALVPMDMGSSLRTQSSPLGSDWQYWSRVVRGQPNPQKIVAHIATIFSEV
jgi:Prokaryotic E2 family E